MTPIVITGIGLISPMGCSREKTWTNVMAGHPVFSVRNAQDFPEGLGDYVRTAPFVNSSGNPRIFPIALSAAHEAVQDSGLDLERMPPESLGCSVSVSKPIFHVGEDFPYQPDSVIQYLAEKLGLGGSSQNFVAACATGIHSILGASRWIGEGLCDVAIAGSCEASLQPFMISGFKNLGVLSRHPRPFDLRRDGFIMAEGAGVLVLEKKSAALARGARIYAEIAGCSVGSDTSHPTRLREDGSSISGVIARALKEAALEPGQIDYVNLHGTGTAVNDPVETLAVKKVFNGSAARTSFSSTKASTGHLLGAAGSLEAALCCLALRDQFAPPTAGLEQPDPTCDLDYTPASGKKRPVSAALSLSFGFGGPIGAVIFKKP